MFKSPSVFDIARAVGYLLLIGNMLISYYHALELERALVALPDPLPHVWVVSLDLVFILSVIVLSQSGGRGFLPWLLFLFGLAFTGWSNIRMSVIEHNREGIIVNGSTVVALLLLELLLRWMEKNREMFGHTRETHTAHVDTHGREKLRDPHTTHTNASHTSRTQAAHTQETSHTAQEETRNTQSESHVSHITQKKPHTSQADSSLAQEAAHAEQASTLTQKEEISARQGSPSSHTKESAHSEENTPHTAQKDLHVSHKTPHASHTSQTEMCEDEEAIRTLAEAMRAQSGKLPSIRTLAKEAKCSEWKARKVLSMLKKQAS